MTEPVSIFGFGAPLAARMRPVILSEVIGQRSALQPGSPLSLLAKPPEESNSFASVLLWGPPGSGKTTIARAIANTSKRRFVELSAVSSGVKELREVIDRARLDQETYGVHTLVFLDEIHRFSKAQQDALLPAVEAGWILLLAATTENPSFSVIAPLMSRSLLVRLEALTKEEICEVVSRALSDPRGLAGSLTLASEALNRIAAISGGDARRALTLLEVAAGRTTELNRSEISLDDVQASMEVALVRFDRDGDQHYDTVSAFIKSVRGSDPDASIHYLARMLEGGEDPRFIARRLVILASEDIGLADPTALPLAMAAFDSVSVLGMPEGRIPLAEVTIYLSLAPKSNTAYQAINSAISDVKAGFQPEIPGYLRSSSMSRGPGPEYKYPHDSKLGVLRQDYLSEYRSYYQPGEMGFERTFSERWARLKPIIRGEEA